MLANVLDIIQCRIKPSGIEKPATMRMSNEKEAKMIASFDDWKLNIINSQNS